jgi:hypothetical protein
MIVFWFYSKILGLSEVSGFDKRTSLFDAGVHYSGEKVHSTASDIQFFSLLHNGRQDTQHNDIQHNDIQNNNK